MRRSSKQFLLPAIAVLLLAPLAALASTFENPLGTGEPEGIIRGIIERIIKIMLAVAGSAALAGIIYGGLRIIIGAAANEADLAHAKKIIIWSILGLLVIGLASVILRAVKVIL